MIAPIMRHWFTVGGCRPRGGWIWCDAKKLLRFPQSAGRSNTISLSLNSQFFELAGYEQKIVSFPDDFFPFIRPKLFQQIFLALVAVFGKIRGSFVLN